MERRRIIDIVLTAVLAVSVVLGIIKQIKSHEDLSPAHRAEIFRDMGAELDPVRQKIGSSKIPDPNKPIAYIVDRARLASGRPFRDLYYEAQYALLPARLTTDLGQSRLVLLDFGSEEALDQWLAEKKWSVIARWGSRALADKGLS